MENYYIEKESSDIDNKYIFDDINKILWFIDLVRW